MSYPVQINAREILLVQIVLDFVLIIYWDPLNVSTFNQIKIYQESFSSKNNLKEETQIYTTLWLLNNLDLFKTGFLKHGKQGQ